MSSLTATPISPGRQKRAAKTYVDVVLVVDVDVDVDLDGDGDVNVAARL